MGVELVKQVLAQVEGEDLSAAIYDPVRAAIERCKPRPGA